MCRERLLAHTFGLTAISRFDPGPGKSERLEAPVGRSLLGDAQGRVKHQWCCGGLRVLPVSNLDTNLAAGSASAWWHHQRGVLPWGHPTVPPCLWAQL